MVTRQVLSESPPARWGSKARSVGVGGVSRHRGTSLAWQSVQSKCNLAVRSLSAPLATVGTAVARDSKGIRQSPNICYPPLVNFLSHIGKSSEAFKHFNFLNSRQTCYLGTCYLGSPTVLAGPPHAMKECQQHGVSVADLPSGHPSRV